MAKRFGRNQRRRMREEIADTKAQLVRAINREDRLYARAKQAEHKLEMWARDIIALTTDHSAFRLIWSEMFSRQVDMLRFPAVERTHSMDMTIAGAPMPTKMSHSVIEAFIYTLQADMSDPRRIIVRLRNEARPTEDWRYAIDARTFRAMPPRLVQSMADQIARQLAEHVRRYA